MYLFFDYLEVLLGAIFIGVFCDVEQKNKYCLISSIISFFVMEIMQTYDLFGNEMAYVLAITNFVIVSIVKKEVKFYNFIPCILFTWISVFTSTIVLFFFKVITNYNIENIIKLYRIPIIFLARIIFLVLIVVLNYFKTKIKDTIIEKNKYLLTITMMLIFGIYFILLNDIGHMQITIDDIYVVLLLLLVLFFVVCILFIHMTRLYNEKTEYMLKNQELEYVEKNQSLVHYLHDNILKIQHSLRYGLILIENNIDDKKYDDAKHQIEQFYDLLDNKTNIMTNNYIFDTLLNDYIFLINSKYNAKVKSLINIGNDSFFKDVNNCTKIINIISNFFEQSNKTYLEIKLIEHESYIELDLFVESNFDKINDDTNIDCFDDYAHLRRIFDK